MSIQGFKVNKYEVVDSKGEVHTIESRWMFDDDGVLTFRHGERGNSRIIAAFAPGCWLYVKMIKEDDNDSKDQTDQTSGSE